VEMKWQRLRKTKRERRLLPAEEASGIQRLRGDSNRTVGTLRPVTTEPDSLHPNCGICDGERHRQDPRDLCPRAEGSSVLA
jgi:hypothetical protein